MATSTQPGIGARVNVQPAATLEELFEQGRWTASAIRKEVRLIRARDAVDWIDWFVSIESTLSELSEEIISGRYVPSPPTRYELAKSHGAFRVITSFNMRDAIVYRHIWRVAHISSA